MKFPLKNVAEMKWLDKRKSPVPLISPESVARWQRNDANHLQMAHPILVKRRVSERRIGQADVDRKNGIDSGEIR